MKNELFAAIHDNYNNASFQLWYWYGDQNFFVKILFILWVCIASLFMKTIGFLFSLGVILDKTSTWLQNKRGGIIDAVSNASSKLGYRAYCYITSTIKVVLLAPLALFLGIIPKWSSTLAVGLHPDLDVDSGTEYGYFAELGKEYLSFLKSLYSNLSNHGKLFILPGLVFALAVTPLILIIALFFLALIVLDWIGWLVSLIRKFVVSSSGSFAKSAGKNAGGVVVMPILLVLFVPIYVALLLIPKIATYDRG